MRRLSWYRIAAVGLAAGLIFALAGDRGLTQSGTVQGIDPLEVLDLQIKPNIVVVVDTSGSMTATVFDNGTRGDHPFSKMYQAKQVLKQVIQDNANSAQFMFGQYRYQSPTSFSSTGLVINGTPSRFSYHTQSWAAVTGPPPFPIEGPSPGMATQEESLGRLFAFQIIQATPELTNNTLVYRESGAPGDCTVSIPTGFYQTGGALATAMQNAMNTQCSAPNRQNTYTVTYNTGVFTFSRDNRDFQLRWSLSNIDGVLRSGPGDTGFGSSRSTGDARIVVLYRNGGDEFTETYDPDGAAGPSPVRDVTTYFADAQKLWNGETVYVTSGGVACYVEPATTLTKTNPPSFKMQRLSSCPGTNPVTTAPTNTVGSPVTWEWSGGGFGGQGSCQGFVTNVPLIACDRTGPAQFTGIAPFLEREAPLNADGSVTGYQETTDGTGAVLSNPAVGGLRAAGATPISQSLNDIRAIFGELWNVGQPNSIVTGGQTLPPISTHTDPKEKTIVLFVTDGDQNCSPFTLGGGSVGSPYNPTSMSQSDAAALGAAASAMSLYTPIAGGSSVNADGTINGDEASSVTTYVVGFGGGGGITPQRLNAIAWGGSGMRRGTGTYGGQPTWTSYPTAAERANCRTCVDAFIAPDAATLASVLSGILNQGATSGEFTSQGSLVSSVYEYVDLAADKPSPADPFDARNPNNRYDAITPVRFLSTFTLPGYAGRLQAFIGVDPDGTGPLPPVAARIWKLRTTSCSGQVPPGPPCFGDAGAILAEDIALGMNTCNTGGNSPMVTGECIFSQLHGNATDSNIGTAGGVAIRRRIYTTTQNGVYGTTAGAPATASQLIAGSAPFRVSLWPPQAASISPTIDPPNGVGLLDAPMGLPGGALLNATDFTNLQSTFRACKGTVGGTPVDGGSSSHPCSSANAASVRADRARKEAREMILAFMAGAQYRLDVNGDPVRVGSGGNKGEIIYQRKNLAILADSTLATPAVVEPPVEAEPGDFVDEYRLFSEGPRDNSSRNPDSAGVQIKQGFGLRSPDADGTTPPSGNGTGANDTRNLKPVMTVVYAGANDMLHAFRAGPNVSPSNLCNPATDECGGQELWGFVPFDSLGVLKSRLLRNPQRRNPHDYMIARGIRVADIFVPEPLTNVNIGGVTIPSMRGVWRRVMIFGRGAGGKYLTALDVTGPGTYRSRALNTLGPIALWSRGNPDTSLGALGGFDNNPFTILDKTEYAKMGQTWSLPAVGFVDRGAHATARKPFNAGTGQGGVDFVAWAGSGYGDRSGCPLSPCEGTTFYTLDVLTGDVIKAADVEPVAVGNSMGRTGVTYNNAIVANPAAFNPSRFVDPPETRHPAVTKTTRVYVSDLYGRLWKFLTADSSVAIPVADLGVNPDQPVGTPVSLLGLPSNPTPTGIIPHVYAVSGNERRAPGPFNAFAFRDDGDDTTTTTSGTVTTGSVKAFLPAALLFEQVLDPPTQPVLNPVAPSPFPVFRGTTQPATAFTDEQPPKGVAFFVGTRFNPPGSAYAPVPPPFPCRSTFDSIVFVLNADSGTAAYDLNATGDDAYVIFQNSRIAGIQVMADPASPTGASVAVDEGLRKPSEPEDAPPEAGQPPTTTTPDVRPEAKPGQPMPTVRFGSTVCQ